MRSQKRLTRTKALLVVVVATLLVSVAITSLMNGRANDALLPVGLAAVTCALIWFFARFTGESKLRSVEKGGVTRSQKGFTLVELLIVISIILIIAAVAIPSFWRNQATVEFKSEFGFDRYTPTPERYKPIVQAHLDKLCAQYRATDEWVGGAVSEAFAQIRAQQAQEAYEHYERARTMALDNGFIEDTELVYKERTEDGGFVFKNVNSCLLPEERTAK